MYYILYIYIYICVQCLVLLCCWCVFLDIYVDICHMHLCLYNVNLCFRIYVISECFNMKYAYLHLCLYTFNI